MTQSNELPDDLDLEQRVFSHAGLLRLPDGSEEELNTDPDTKELQPLIRELWAAYCDMEIRALQAEEVLKFLSTANMSTPHDYRQVAAKAIASEAR